MIFFKSGHRPGFAKYLITIRNCFFQKSFPNCEKNLQKFFLIAGTQKLKNYVEIGVGYTITDFLVLEHFFEFETAHLTDLNYLFCPRTYAASMLLNPNNYASSVFQNNLAFLFNLLIFGHVKLRKKNILYTTEDAVLMEFPGNSFIYSNAVLEHLPPDSIDQFISHISESKPALFGGIVDTNDHLYRSLPKNEQFANYNQSALEIQIRGNNVGADQWAQVFRQYFSEVSMDTHSIDDELIHNIYVFCCK